MREATTKTFRRAVVVQAYKGLSPPQSITTQENTPQACLHPNVIIEAFSQLSFLLSDDTSFYQGDVKTSLHN